MTTIVVEFGQNENQRCNNCKTRTALVLFDMKPSFHPEPFESGQLGNDAPEAEHMKTTGKVCADGALMAHLCPKCEKITAVFFNNTEQFVKEG